VAYAEARKKTYSEKKGKDTPNRAGFLLLNYGNFLFQLGITVATKNGIFLNNKAKRIGRLARMVKARDFDIHLD